MPIPTTRACPHCEADMELLTADDDGEVVVYECPDCGSQVEAPVRDDESDVDQDSDVPPDPDEAGFEVSEPDDAA